MAENGDTGRTQPEFSLGERLARMEARIESRAEIESSLQEQLDRRLAEHKELFNEKFAGDRRESEAIHKGLESAISRVENTSDKKLDLLGERFDRGQEGVFQRLGALERGDSASEGERRFRANQWVAIGSIAAIGYLIVLLLTTHVLG